MSEALRLADLLETGAIWQDQEAAAAELRRLHALNAELVEALRQVEGIINLSPHALSITRTALMKAKLEYENEDR